MNCEKCKNRKATVFFADEGGGRHALCASCSATKSRAVTKIDTREESEAAETKFIPQTTIYSMSDTHFNAPMSGDLTVSCRGCGISAELAKSLGHMCCPECYSSFGDLLFPAQVSSLSASGVKMPYLLQQRANKEKILAELRSQLKSLIECENFEQAATVRDKIRSIENRVR